MTTKPYNTTAEPTHHDRPHHRPVLEFVGLWIFAAVCAIVGVVGGGEALSMDPSTPLAHLGQTALGIVALLFLAAAVSCAAYARLEHGVAYGSREPKIKTTREKQRVVHTHTEAIPKANGGGVEFKQETRKADFEYPVEDVARGVEWMLRNGSSRDSVTAGIGWGQKEWARIMRSLSDLGIATKQGRSFKLRPDRAHDWARSVLGDDLASIVDELDNL